jgi:hypothetical protein
MSRPAASYRHERRAETQARNLLWRELPRFQARGQGAGSCVVIPPPEAKCRKCGKPERAWIHCDDWHCQAEPIERSIA